MPSQSFFAKYYSEMAVKADGELALVPGHIAHNMEIKARWAYSEIVSTRIGKMYQDHLPLIEVAKLALAGVSFDDLPEIHHQALADAVSQSHAGAMPAMDQHKSFVLRSWGKAQLADAYVDRFFNTPHRDLPLRFSHFLVWSRNTGPNGAHNPNDPRVAADGVPRGTPPLTDAAPVAVGRNGNYIVVEGLLRCTLFMRDAPASATLPVWVGIS